MWCFVFTLLVSFSTNVIMKKILQAGLCLLIFLNCENQTNTPKRNLNQNLWLSLANVFTLWYSMLVIVKKHDLCIVFENNIFLHKQYFLLTKRFLFFASFNYLLIYQINSKQFPTKFTFRHFGPLSKGRGIVFQ